MLARPRCRFSPAKEALGCVDIDNKGENPDEVAKKGDNPYLVMADVKGYEVAADRKKILVRKDDDFFILDSDVTAKSLGDAKVLGQAKIDLSPWEIMVNPQAEFKQLFLDAWRLERDYFYDRKKMHGTDWIQLRDRYLPLVDRVSDRRELDDVIAQNGERALGTSHRHPRRGRAPSRRPGGPGRPRRSLETGSESGRLRGRARLSTRRRLAESGAPVLAPRLSS